MPAIYVHTHTVTAAETDWQGHANNVSYFHWLQDAAVDHSSAQGWNASRYKDAGIAWVARSHYIEYRSPCRAGDVINVRTWCASFRRATSVRRYRIMRPQDNLCIAVAETKWAFVDWQTGKPRRIHDEVSSTFDIVDAEMHDDV